MTAGPGDRAGSPPVQLTGEQARALRLRSLLLDGTAPGSGDRPADVQGVVTWFGAMQAQDLASVQWSVGLRLPGSTVAEVTAAEERREVLRTWPMRGTVHLVPARDAHWMLQLMGAKPLAGAAGRRANLGLDDAVAEHAVAVLADTLSGGRRRTRAECIAALQDAGIGCAGQRGYHLLWYASQRGVTCIAPSIDGAQTFALLDEWVADPRRPDPEEALATVALRYVRSHGPVTPQDLARWTGLTVTQARRGIAACGSALVPVTVDERPMVAAAPVPADPPAPDPDRIAALPGFDEFMLGYRDRSWSLDAEHWPAVVPGSNGVFQATLVRGGRVVGTWRRVSGRTRTVVTVRPLVRLRVRDRAGAQAALAAYAAFTGRPVEVRWD